MLSGSLRAWKVNRKRKKRKRQENLGKNNVCSPEFLNPKYTEFFFPGSIY